ncbi:ABC transporter ATP-binding protein [Streptomyces sp. NPDC086077]|uniref:ABC transporter ATP-binding protein n=1 Tax=Streptomyces sp. NPDC086077 TaxID=3154862 RepID=UPI003416A3B8
MKESAAECSVGDPATDPDVGDPDRTALEARGLSRRFGRSWALRDCSFRLPAGRICALVGPNGAGKTTLLSMAADVLEPTCGTLSVFGEDPKAPASRGRVAFVGQSKPLYPGFSVADMLRAGREMNPGWDQGTAERLVRQGDIPLSAKVGHLSGGQRTRVALALALGKRPRLLLLDEPMSDLDPRVRHEMTAFLMSEVAEHGTTVLMSTHLVSEMDAVCDYLVTITGGRVQLAGEIDTLLAAHTTLVGRDRGQLPPAELASHTVVSAERSGGQVTALIRPEGPVAGTWMRHQPHLEELLIAYLGVSDVPPLITPSARTCAGKDAA